MSGLLRVDGVPGPAGKHPSPVERLRGEPVSVSTTVRPWTAWAETEGTWRELHTASPYKSFFLTTEWISTWLAVFGEQLKPEILIARDGDRVIGACLLVVRRVKVGPFPVTRVFSIRRAEDEADETYLEFNDVLCLEGAEDRFALALKSHLSARRWDELVLDGCMKSTAVAAVVAASAISRRRIASAAASMSRSRDSATPTPRSRRVSRRNSRRNLKRTTTAYQLLGQIRFEIAATAAEGHAMLEGARAAAPGAVGSAGPAGRIQFREVHDLQPDADRVPLRLGPRPGDASPGGQRGRGRGLQPRDGREGLLLPVRLQDRRRRTTSGPDSSPSTARSSTACSAGSRSST